MPFALKGFLTQRLRGAKTQGLIFGLTPLSLHHPFAPSRLMPFALKGFLTQRRKGAKIRQAVEGLECSLLFVFWFWGDAIDGQSGIGPEQQALSASSRLENGAFASLRLMSFALN